MKTTRRTCIILMALLLLALPSLLTGCGGTSQQTGKLENGKVTRYGKGYRFDSNGWTYVHIEGEPYQRGFQHGRLVAPELAQVEKTLRQTMLDDTTMTSISRRPTTRARVPLKATTSLTRSGSGRQGGHTLPRVRSTAR